MTSFLRILLPVLLLAPWLSAEEPAADSAPIKATGGQVDPAVLAPLTAPTVGWRAGDRLTLVGDLLVAPGQPELALRLQEALTAGRSQLDLVVRGVQNHGISLYSWQEGLTAELARRRPQVVVICAGIGDALSAKNSKSQPLTLAEWSTTLSNMVRASQVAGAAVVIATPAILGDKPTEGPFFAELEAYAAAARTIAADTKSELCELRIPLLAMLTTKNPGGTSELGVLSRKFGELRVPAMDLIAGRLASSIAAAVARIPWSIEIPNSTFSSNGKAVVQIIRNEAANVSIYVTTNGTEPTTASPVYVEPIPVTTTTRVRALAVAKDGSKHTAEGWCMETKKRAADPQPAGTLSGLWVDHYTFRRWRSPMPSIESLKPDFETWSPGCDLGAIGRVPVHRWPNTNFGLRFSGYFVAPYDGIYIFSTNADDVSRLAIGDTMVVHNDELNSVRWAYGAIELAKGFHPFTVIYGQGPGAAALDIFVALPGQRAAPIPELLLRRPAVKTSRKGLEADKDEAEDAKPAEEPGAP